MHPTMAEFVTYFLALVHALPVQLGPRVAMQWVALAAHESAWGTSDVCRTRANYTGWRNHGEYVVFRSAADHVSRWWEHFGRRPAIPAVVQADGDLLAVLQSQGYWEGDQLSYRRAVVRTVWRARAGDRPYSAALATELFGRRR